MNADTFRAILAPSTKSGAMLKTRSSYLAQLYRHLGSDKEDLSFLNNTRAVLKIIRDSDNINTQKTRIFHVMAILRLPQGKVVDKKSKDLYTKIAAELKLQGNAAYADNVMSDVQKQRYMSLDGLNRALERAVIDLFNKYGIKRTAQISADEFNTWNIESTRNDNIYTFARDLQSLAVLACYIWQPALRNDYASLEITAKAIGLKRDHNWIQMRKNGSITIVMNVYKNAKSMGKQTITVGEKLTWMLNYWHDLLRKLLPGKPKQLFYYTINANHTIKRIEDSRTLGRQIPRMGEKFIGRALSVNDYRHIWELHIQSSEDYKRATVNQRTKMHEQLLHGHMMGVQYASVRRDENTDSNEA